MPRFTERYVEVYVDIDVTVDELLSKCTQSDIKDLIKALKEEGHLNTDSLVESDIVSLHEGEFISKLSSLSSKYYSMSNEDIEKIEELHKKYC
jgi:hypothetical protein